MENQVHDSKVGERGPLDSSVVINHSVEHAIGRHTFSAAKVFFAETFAASVKDAAQTFS